MPKPYIELNAEFKVHVKNLLQETLNNAGTSIMEVPFRLLLSRLAQIADRAIELNDPKLTALCCSLALFEQSDPESKEYDVKMVEEAVRRANQLHNEETAFSPVRKLRKR